MPSIAEILLEQGRQVADARRREGEQTAQMWSGVGQTIANAPLVYQQAQRQEQGNQITSFQLDQLKRTQATQDALESALKNPSNYKQDGSVDDQAVSSDLKSKNVNAWQQWSDISAKNFKNQLETREAIEKITTSQQTREDKARQVALAQQNYLGGLAYHATQTMDDNPNDPLHVRDTFLASVARAAADPVASGVNEQHAKDMLMQTAQAQPGQLRQVLDSLITPDVRSKLDKEYAENAKNNADAYKAYQPKDAVPKALQRESVMLDGKPTIVMVDPDPAATNKVMSLTGEPIPNADTRVRPIPPASVQVLNTLGDGTKDNPTAKAIAEYRLSPPSPRTLSTPAGEMLMKQVMTENPAYDATQFPTRQKMRQAFTSGPQSQTINSLNTAISHLDQFTTVVKALDNGNFQPGNQAYNWLKTTFGDSAPTNFAGIRDIMSGELASAFKKSGATDDEIKSVKSAIASKNSTNQLLDYVKTIALPALGSKVVSFDQQYRQVMGPNDPFKILLPESADILTKYGIDPAHPQMGGGGASGAGSTIQHWEMQNGKLVKVGG